MLFRHPQPRYATEPVGTAEDAKNLYAAYKYLNLSLVWLSLAFNAFLCGIFLFQLVHYWSARHRDPWWVKACVVYVTVMVYGSWKYAVYTRFLAYIFLSIFVIIDACTAAAIQAFFTYRTFRLNNRNWYLVGILSALICTSIGGAISQAVIYITFYYDHVRGNVLSPIVVWTCASMAADLIITISILWGLSRTRTGWHHSDKVILRLIRMTLEAQVPPLILTSVYTIIFIIYLNHQLAAYINNSKLNAIGFLYSLNSRVALMHHDVTMTNRDGTDWRISQMKSAMQGASTTVAPVDVGPSRLFGFARKSAGGASETSEGTLVNSASRESGDPLTPTASKADPLVAIKET
ncbi:hypothetical protein Q8F55_007712 [Vanrija albida]|uniref:DUF6534 domain-containing protein n=1 Tax=Vanrija albida TaxID=181172 RepID=A0ABR3PUA2_9TREE